MKPSLVLRLALDDLEAYGWCQREMFDDDGRHCAIGAMASAIRDVPSYDRAIGFLRRGIGVNGGNVARWNDTRSRTYPQVRAAFLRAIALAESEGR